MSDFLIYLEIGLHHVLDIRGYDHILFLIALTVPYAFKDWKRVLLLVSIFTIGHTLALILSVFGVIMIKETLVEFLIPITILVTAAYNLFMVGKTTKKESVNIVGFITLFFGIIHGLGFSNYFKTILSGNPSDKVAPLFEFAIGIELAQLIVVLVILLISFIMHHFGRFSKRDFTLVMSAFVIGMVVPMLIENDIWNK
ncbi:MAG TPA: HupE/UreJ family protein [Flavobacterium sp.]|nr:HupE/UreJ family protein [Flavobacterium sp.]